MKTAPTFRVSRYPAHPYRPVRQGMRDTALVFSKPSLIYSPSAPRFSLEALPSPPSPSSSSAQEFSSPTIPLRSSISSALPAFAAESSSGDSSFDSCSLRRDTPRALSSPSSQPSSPPPAIKSSSPLSCDFSSSDSELSSPPQAPHAANASSFPSHPGPSSTSAAIPQHSGSDVQVHEQKIRGVEKIMRWFSSSGADRLAHPPATKAQSSGDIFVHTYPGQVQLWMWSGCTQWVEVAENHVHPSLHEHRLWMKPGNVPAWISRKTISTYKGRAKKRTSVL